MPTPDQKYIDALLSNDLTVLNDLYKKFSGKIRWMVLQNNGTDTDAADIFQESLLAIYYKARTGSMVLTCPFEGFLYAIAWNKWMKELTKRKRMRVTNLDDNGFNWGEDCFKLAEECYMHEKRRELLFRTLPDLGDGCKNLLQLSWSGISMEEVAGKMNMTYGYARKRKSMCVAELIKLMKASNQYNLLKIIK
jgi:RNA polymerase sigma factor (sigma-70 family)